SRGDPSSTVTRTGSSRGKNAAASPAIPPPPITTCGCLCVGSMPPPCQTPSPDIQRAALPTGTGRDGQGPGGARLGTAPPLGSGGGGGQLAGSVLHVLGDAVGAGARLRAVRGGAGVRVAGPDAAGHGAARARGPDPELAPRHGQFVVLVRGQRAGPVAVPAG